jgi:hypothetical protein
MDGDHPDTQMRYETPTLETYGSVEQLTNEQYEGSPPPVLF